MPERLNDWTLKFKQGEATIPELGWWGGKGWYEGCGLFTRDPTPEDPSFSISESNFWLRRPPWNSKDGQVKTDCVISVPKAILDNYLVPATNEWGEVCP